MAENGSILFDGLLTRYIKTIEKSIKSRIKKARDKETVRKQIESDLDFYINLSVADKNQVRILDVFSDWYKRGENTGKTLAFIRKTFGEDVNDILPFQRIENGKSITLYISEEDKELKSLVLNERKLIKFLIRYVCHLEMKKRLQELFNEAEKPEIKNRQQAIVKWTGSKDNKNEFVQLIYGLHQAGFINEGKGEITKIIEALSEVFNIQLGENWQSNHSASIHKVKSDYHAPIFRKIQQAYEAYTNSLIESKKKNR
jgi:hypothetical protein